MARAKVGVDGGICVPVLSEASQGARRGMREGWKQLLDAAHLFARAGERVEARAIARYVERHAFEAGLGRDQEVVSVP